MDRRVTPSKQVPRLPGVPHLHVNRPFKRHFILASFMLNFITETWPYFYAIQGFLNNWVFSYLYDRYQTQRGLFMDSTKNISSLHLLFSALYS